MPDFEVKQGDCIGSISDETGFFWQTIWDHPENAGLKERRGNPNALLPGDRLFVPEKTPKSVRCATGRRHVFRRRGVPSQLKLRLLDRESRPRAGIPFTLEVDGNEVEGSTSGDGRIAVPISPRALEARLTLRPEGAPEETYSFRLGHLNPADDPAGIQGRLRNLGFYLGPITGELDDATRAALERFQADAGLPVTGQADEATSSALSERHGG